MILSVEQQIGEQVPFEDFKTKWCEKYPDVYEICPNYEDLFWAITFYSKEDELVDFTNENFNNNGNK